MPEPANVFVAQAAALVAEAQQALKALKSPREHYEAQQAEIKRELQGAWDHLAAASLDGSDVTRTQLQDKILEYGWTLKEMQIAFEATLPQKQRIFEEHETAIVQNLRTNLAAFLATGDHEASRQQLSSTGPIDRAPDELSGSDQSPSPILKGNEDARIPADSEVNPQVDREMNLEADNEGDTEGDTEDGPGTNKRHRDGSESSGSLQPQKRRQIHGKRFVDFSDVWQDGKAQTKHLIVEYPEHSNRWFVFRCDEHNMEFKNNPIIGAAKHLSGAKHGGMPRTFDVAVEHLGIEVRQCTKAKVDMNNAAALVAFGNEKSSPAKTPRRPTEKPSTTSREASNTKRRTTRTDRRPVPSEEQEVNEIPMEPLGIVDPIPGRVYLGFWHKSKEWLAVLLLPTTNLPDIGVPGTLEQLGLYDNIPVCYSRSTRTKDLEFKKDYKIGGALASQRQFPVMYFDGLPFPAKSAVGWVAATDLQEFDADQPSSLIPNLKQVRAFLKQRQQSRLYEFPSDDEPVGKSPPRAMNADDSAEQASASETTSDSVFPDGSETTRPGITEETSASMDSHHVPKEFETAGIDQLEGTTSKQDSVNQVPNTQVANDIVMQNTLDINEPEVQHDVITLHDSDSDDGGPQKHASEISLPSTHEEFDEWIEPPTAQDEVSITLEKANGTNGSGNVVSDQLTNNHGGGDATHCRRDSNAAPINPAAVEWGWDPNMTAERQDTFRPSPQVEAQRASQPTPTLGLAPEARMVIEPDMGSSQQDESPVQPSEIAAPSNQPENTDTSWHGEILQSVARASLSQALASIDEPESTVPPAVSYPFVTGSTAAWSPINGRNINIHPGNASYPHGAETLQPLPNTLRPYDTGNALGNGTNGGSPGHAHLTNPGYPSTRLDLPPLRISKPFGPWTPQPLMSPVFTNNSATPDKAPVRHPASIMTDHVRHENARRSSTSVPLLNQTASAPTQAPAQSASPPSQQSKPGVGVLPPVTPVFTIPSRVWNQLNTHKNRYEDAPGSNTFRDSKGAFICPLCPRRTEYLTVTGFSQHLASH